MQRSLNEKFVDFYADMVIRQNRNEVISIDLGVVLFYSIALWYDWKENRIPNELIYLGMTSCIIYIFETKGLGQLGMALLQMGKVFLFLFPFFAIGAIGAGDIKLLMMIAGYFFDRNYLVMIFYIFLLAVVIGVVKLVREKIWLERIYYASIYIKEVVEQRRLALYETEPNQQGTRIKSKKTIEKYKIHMAFPIFLGVMCKIANWY